ncbi:LIVCS family branched-chain amino acid:cation transporter [Pasteurella langaaensis DSM 22999]|uniref:Branched-chain amino acid transport system carrier protein n=1 Tax=Alitibacter langaaensis DSM 22999 TaxID=1122935 RepID=A0A2U0T6K2_9PAST|nr:branched-chain amino acid transport system II carrier protein [Pasteurella langaaensis]PVX39187.1 LIVCS family branched-chain amino acid:cation transporter [Pasteurella langaaensis DSM 22999]
MNKNTFIVGFMLFAIFFGAGNLIFPPKLGFESHSEYFPATLGFIVTGVGLPLLGIIVSSFYPGGYTESLKKIHPWFSVIFLSAIYLSVGPFVAIPRTAATSYELSLLPYLTNPSGVSLYIFSGIYFIAALWLALNPSKMVERVGSILTPVLLFALAALVIKSAMLLNHESAPLIPQEPVFFKGFVSGYLTMDALASIAYSVIVISAIQSKGVSKQELPRQTLFAGIIAASALTLIYLSLSWLGSKIPLSAETLDMLQQKNLDLGTYILNALSLQAFGELGHIVLGIVVTLACLTTAIGLIVSVSEYFYSLYHKISYKLYALFFTVLSFLIANQGLNTVLSKSIPVLLTLYPIAITVILLMGINLLVKVPLIAQRCAIFLVAIVSLSSTLELDFTQLLPLKNYSMEWVPVALGGLLIGYLLSLVKRSNVVE